MDEKKLIRLALDARRNAYAPYSGFAVGAALLAESGRIYCGCNVESASYPATVCAERTALCSAVAAGEKRFVAIAVAGGKAFADPQETITPCGVCRQLLAEFGDLTVICAKSEGEYRRYRLSQLLPDGFSGAVLPDFA